MLADKLAKVAIDRSIVEDSLTADHSAATALFDSSGHMIARCGWRSLRRLRRLGLGCYGKRYVKRWLGSLRRLRRLRLRDGWTRHSREHVHRSIRLLSQ